MEGTGRFGVRVAGGGGVVSIRSMTGYGHGEARGGGLRVEV